MIKQQKAKTFGKDKIKSTEGLWRLSRKYDGHQVFIQKEGKEVTFFTSNHKQFNIESIRQRLAKFSKDFILIGEFLYNSDGKLGSRTKSAKLTTYRTNFNKGLSNDGEAKVTIKVFDCIPINNGLHLEYGFNRRMEFLNVKGVPGLDIVTSSLVNFKEASRVVKGWVAEGWEGGMLIDTESPYEEGKRVHHAIKLKGRHTADLECIGVNAGIGKYLGMIGSLLLRDSDGTEVSVGSGLTDLERNSYDSVYLGKVIEIQYEQMLDTYIQPVYIGIRKDKKIKEID
jgi:ATP-dependent DNA ligase